MFIVVRAFNKLIPREQFLCQLRTFNANDVLNNVSFNEKNIASHSIR